MASSVDRRNRANRHDVLNWKPYWITLSLSDQSQQADKLQHLCADKGYDGKPAYQSIVDRDYIPHVRRRGEEIEAKKNVPGYRHADGL